MRFAYTLSGGSPFIKKYKVAASHAVGIVVLRTAADSGGLSTSTTTSVADSVGVTMDQGMAIAAGGTVAYSTTAGAQEAVYSIIINPDAVFAAQIVTGATGTACTARTVTSASTPNTVVTTGYDYSSPEQDEGIIWCTSGTNVGQSRKITSTGTTAATVTVPFLSDVNVGDVFASFATFIGEPGVTFTTDLTNVRNEVAQGSDAVMTIVDWELNGLTNSYVHIQANDSVFAGSPT